MDATTVNGFAACGGLEGAQQVRSIGTVVVPSFRHFKIMPRRVPFTRGSDSNVRQSSKIAGRGGAQLEVWEAISNVQGDSVAFDSNVGHEIVTGEGGRLIMDGTATVFELNA